jgi:uncharacterized protein (DUF433 family)
MQERGCFHHLPSDCPFLMRVAGLDGKLRGWIDLGLRGRLTFALIFDGHYVKDRSRDSEKLKGEMKMPGRALRRENTNHPFIVKNKDICSGSPVIEGTRTRVIDIAIEYEMLGHSPDEIIRSHPHLNLPQVHDALSFYYENRDELDQKAERDQKFIAHLRKKIHSKLS